MSKIETQVMAGVAVIYSVRALLSYTALKVYALMAAVWALGYFVWVARVMENLSQVAQNGFPGVTYYLYFAVSHTTVFVQVALLVAIAMLGSLAVDVARRVARTQNSFA